MNSRAWYGVDSHYEEKSGTDKTIDKLLDMYAKAISRYFSVFDSQDYSSIVTLDKKHLPREKALFRDWFLDKGLPYLKRIAKMTHSESENISSKIEYELYILEEEMDFEYPDDVRSTLISIVNDLPDYIEIPLEVSVPFNSSMSSGVQSKQLDELISNVNKSYSVYGEDFHKQMSKYEESTAYVGSSFFYILRGNKFGNIRVLQDN